jgi:MerR family transcriptional regulator/heat shock protein HspR
MSENDNLKDARSEPVYMISVAAKLCDVHVQTLRLYERLGLIRPARIKGKNRLYSESDIMRVRQIQTLTQVMGVNLAGVEVIFRLKEQMEEMRSEMQNELERMHSEATAKLEEIVKQFSLPVSYKVPLPAEMPQLSEDLPIPRSTRGWKHGKGS